MSKRFNDLASPRKFARISIYSNKKGFRDLQRFLAEPRLCGYVKKFSYLAYGLSSLTDEEFDGLLLQASANTADIQDELRQRVSPPQVDRSRPSRRVLDSSLAQSRADEVVILEMKKRSEAQRNLIDTALDATWLLIALESFTALEQIRLMPLFESLDEKWSNFCQRKGTLPLEAKAVRWSRGCEAAGLTLGNAYLTSGSNAKRFSARRLPPLMLLHSTELAVNLVSRRIECLELNFDDRSSLVDELRELSDIFRRGFTAAENIRGLHVGFTRPTAIEFDGIFHDVFWNGLQYLGLVLWKIFSGDLIRFLERHRNSLRCVRLRSILLEDDSQWVEILKVLRRMTRLKWVSLKGERVSEPHPADMLQFESSDEEGYYSSPRSSSSSSVSNFSTAPQPETMDDNSEDSALDETSGDSDANGGNSSDGDASGSEDSEIGYPHTAPGHTLGEDVEVGINDLALGDHQMVQHTTSTDDGVGKCYCYQGFGWTDLRVNEGVRPPTKELWKWWEKWVARRCPLGHDMEQE